MRQKLSPRDEVRLQKAAEIAIATYGGDVVEALKVALVHNGELEDAIRAVSIAHPGLFKITEDAM
ncbi:hypothetical protein [Mesorhizobium sp. Root157]|uniref:hypothetical protein n=1 Tax=Mesorhizobium sp. Root157 TaxID=1736477 RepID=UPI0012E353FC|nr:hypothetical protein [Mesorhizobium sp. Root157]